MYPQQTYFRWLTKAAMQAILGAFGQTDGTAVIKATNAYLNQLAASDRDKATALAGFINEDPMMVCSLGLEPQLTVLPSMPVRLAIFTGTQYLRTGLQSTEVDEVEFDMMYIGQVYSGHVVCGTRSASSANYKIYFVVNDASAREISSAYNSYTPYWNKKADPNTLYHHHHIIRDGYQRFEMNGVVYLTDNKAMQTSHVENTIGAWNGNGSISAQFKGGLGMTILRYNGEDLRWYFPFTRNGVSGIMEGLSNTMQTVSGSGVWNLAFYLPDGTPWTPSTP